jgi:membrane-associated phospholipid phosphatase
MAVMSSLDFWLPLLVAVTLVAAIWGGFRMRMMLVTAGLAIALTDAVVVRTLKDFVGRPRPHEMLEGVRTLDLAAAAPRFLALARPLKEEYSGSRIRPWRGNSFPSAHAANNFAVATVCVLFFRRWGWLLFLPAILVAYSRVYVGSHWPLDVLVSCFLGLGIGLLVVVGVEAVWRRWGELWLPRLHTAYPSLLAV